MFIDFGNSKCPVCGVNGRIAKDNEMFSCPKCLTSFSHFGIITATQTEKEMELN